MKIFFILKTIEQQRCIKRIQTFINQGYDVEVYGFHRKQNVQQQYSFPIHSLGVIPEGASFSQRNKMYLTARKIVRQFRDDRNVLFYLFGLDLALPLIFCGGAKHYIYEESDLIHTKFKSGAVIRLFEIIDKWIIKKSKVSVLTSEGFVRYHYGETPAPKNVCVLPNKLNQKCSDLLPGHRDADFNNLVVGFVGFFRYESVYNFLYVTAKEHPEIRVKLFGANSGWTESQLSKLLSLGNVTDEGSFKNPSELPSVYSKIDLVVSTYDIEDDNPRYAEPNKIYESIYFETPIIVSSQTFLADKVDRLGIGFHLNAKRDDEVIDFWKQLNRQMLEEKKLNCRKIEKDYCIDDESELFEKLK